MTVMKQVVVLALVFNLIFPAVLFAQETPPEPPKIVDLKKDEKAPFAGVLLNPTAGAQMLANQKFTEAGCKLKVDFELKKIKAQHDLMMESLKISMNANENKYTSVLKIKDEEIERLSTIALDRPGDYSHWWAAGGFVVGALVSIGIFYAASQAQK